MKARQEVFGSDGSWYKSISDLAKAIGCSKCHLSQALKDKGRAERYGVLYTLDEPKSKVAPTMNKKEQAEFDEFKEAKKVENLPFKRFDFADNGKRGSSRYAVALFSDAHIEETVDPGSVLGLNEYNVEIAKQRVERYFINLGLCIEADEVEHLVFASLGDTISGFIHDELAQSNGLTPLEATLLAQNLIYSGLEYLCNNTRLKDIRFVGIVGNHSRTTKKIQHSNGYRMSYEWMMYKNIERECKATKLPIEFCLPESEMALLDMEDGNRFIFIHGFQLKSSGTGTVCGIYPALNRLCMKWDRTFKQTRVFLGHFHSCISLPNAMVNGSIIGFNSFALSNGFSYEEPAQMYCVYDPIIGELLTRKIYCK